MQHWFLGETNLVAFEYVLGMNLLFMEALQIVSFQMNWS